MKFINLDMPLTFPEEFQFANSPGVIEPKSDFHDRAPCLFDIVDPSQDQADEIIDWLSVSYPPITNADFHIDPNQWRFAYTVLQQAGTAYDPKTYKLVNQKAPNLWGYQFILKLTMNPNVAVAFKLRFMN